MAELARPPSSAWLLGLIDMASAIGGAGDGMRRLEHLARVEGMCVGEVVVQSSGCFVEDLCCGFVEGGLSAGWKVVEACVEVVAGRRRGWRRNLPRCLDWPFGMGLLFRRDLV